MTRHGATPTIAGVKLDAGLDPGDFEAIPATVRALEAAGYAGVSSFETNHDPFLPLAIAAEHSERIELMTGIAVVFPRNPLHLAYVANDLQALSTGRFILGMGSQVKAHIERRFGVPWSRPAARMRELVLAIRAIWRSFNDGEKLSFEGEFYRHTLMTPFFNPGPNPYGPPRVFIAAVGPVMAEVAGEVADGLLVHAFSTPAYIRQTMLPAVERGLRKAGRDRSTFEISCPVFVVTGDTDQEFSKMEDAIRSQVAFYGSTPQYRRVLDTHGWGDLQEDLNRLTREGRWGDLGSLVDEEVLDAFAVRAAPDELARGILERYEGIADRISLSARSGAIRRVEPDLISTFATASGPAR